MRSAARLTYTEAAGMLVAARPRGPHGELKPELQHLNAVYEAFAGVRKQRGAIDFDLPESKIELDERGQVKNVRAVERLVTHKIIEECMIAANVEAAKRIQKGRIPGLYRVHEGPDEDRLEELVLFLRTFGHKVNPNEALTERDQPRARERRRQAGRGARRDSRPALDETGALSAEQRRALRFGARRLRTLHVADSALSRPARASRDQVAQRQTVGEGLPLRLEEMEQLGEHTSRTERRADEATREVAERLKCVYLKERVGETFDVVISSVVPFGLFVRLPEDPCGRSRARDFAPARLLPQGCDGDSAQRRALGARVSLDRDAESPARRRQRRRAQGGLRPRGE